MQSYDYLVLGSGSAGLSFALEVCQAGTVALITKKERTDSNTNWAQGGIAGVMGPDDDTELHVQDTLIAGAGLCNEEAVRILVTEGPDRIRELISYGAQFNRSENGDLSLGREGGHSRRRIIHTADLTGREVEHTLVDEARSHPNIAVFEHHFAIDLIIQEGQCCGAYVLDEATGGRYLGISAFHTAGNGRGRPSFINLQQTHRLRREMAWQSRIERVPKLPTWSLSNSIQHRSTIPMPRAF